MGTKRATGAAFSEFGKAFGDAPVHDRFRRERDLSPLNAGLQNVAHRDAHLLTNTLRDDHLILLFYSDDSHKHPVELFNRGYQRSD